MDGFPGGVLPVVLSEEKKKSAVKVGVLGQCSSWYRVEVGPCSSWWRSQLAATCPAFVLGIWLLWRTIKTRLHYRKTETFPFPSYFRVQVCSGIFCFSFSKMYVSVLDSPRSLGTFTCCPFCSGRSLPTLECISLETCFGVERRIVLQLSGFPASLVVCALPEGAQGLSPWRTWFFNFPVILE